MNKVLDSLKRISWKYLVNYLAVIIVGGVLSVMTLGGSLPQSTLFLVEEITMKIVLAISLSLVVGFLGELSLGHAGFMCIGAYFGGFTAVLLEKFEIIEGDSIIAFLISLVVGATVAGLFGFIIGLPALRLRGDYLAIVTLAFGEIIKTLLLNLEIKIDKISTRPIIDKASGIVTPRFDKQYFIIIGFVLVLVTIAIVQNLIRSKHGRAITAIRDNEIAAKATGINVTKYKLVAFIISAMLAGVGGVMYSFTNNRIIAGQLDLNYSINLLIIVVLGGMGNISGAIVSATAITFIDRKLGVWMGNELAVMKDILYALILIVIVIYNNAPALKSVREKISIKKLLNFKRVKQGYADDEGKWDRVPTKIDMNEVLSTDVIVNESVKNPDKEDNN